MVWVRGWEWWRLGLDSGLRLPTLHSLPELFPWLLCFFRFLLIGWAFRPPAGVESRPCLYTSLFLVVQKVPVICAPLHVNHFYTSPLWCDACFHPRKKEISFFFFLHHLIAFRVVGVCAKTDAWLCVMQRRQLRSKGYVAQFSKVGTSWGISVDATPTNVVNCTLFFLIWACFCSSFLHTFFFFFFFAWVAFLLTGFSLLSDGHKIALAHTSSSIFFFLSLFCFTEFLLHFSFMRCVADPSDPEQDTVLITFVRGKRTLWQDLVF